MSKLVYALLRLFLGLRQNEPIPQQTIITMFAFGLLILLSLLYLRVSEHVVPQFVSFYY